MIINLKRIEASVLLLHMTITRKNIKRGFKNKYRATKYKNLMNSYDEVKSSLESKFEANNDEETIIDNNPDEIIRFDFNINEINMLESFLSWYVSDLTKLLDDAARLTNKNTLKEDKRQLETLINIENNVKRMKKIQLEV